MGKVFWFAVGVGLTVVVVVKGKQLLRRATPAGVQEQVQHKVAGIGEQVSEFLATLTESMKQREDELRTELGLDDAEKHQPAHA